MFEFQSTLSLLGTETHPGGEASGRARAEATSTSERMVAKSFIDQGIEGEGERNGKGEDKLERHVYLTEQPGGHMY